MATPLAKSALLLSSKAKQEYGQAIQEKVWHILNDNSASITTKLGWTYTLPLTTPSPITRLMPMERSKATGCPVHLDAFMCTMTTSTLPITDHALRVPIKSKVELEFDPTITTVYIQKGGHVPGALWNITEAEGYSGERIGESLCRQLNMRQGQEVRHIVNSE
ncbi:hypothetical protein C8Q72DRAFT_797615 [Fomitopsis betulina]|nr:hypothetical protein C8Q72DRAFT_797615 [Fomitopsis betulina]